MTMMMMIMISTVGTATLTTATDMIHSLEKSAFITLPPLSVKPPSQFGSLNKYELS